MSSEDISAFLNQTITSRIGIRLIAEQYVAISQSPALASSGTPTTRNKPVDHLPGGIIDPECSPERMVRMCAAFVSSLCEATFGTSPDIKIDGVVDARFAYVLHRFLFDPFVSELILPAGPLSYGSQFAFYLFIRLVSPFTHTLPCVCDVNVLSLLCLGPSQLDGICPHWRRRRIDTFQCISNTYSQRFSKTRIVRQPNDEPSVAPTLPLLISAAPVMITHSRQFS